MAAINGELLGFYRSRTRCFDILKAMLKGYHDGFQGRPVKLADGMLDSEYIRAMLAHCEQDLSANWTACLARINALESSLAAYAKELEVLAGQIEALNDEEARIRDSHDAKQRKAGEESLDDGLVASRRRAELRREIGPIAQSRAQKQDRRLELEGLLGGIRSQIREAESVTVLHCNCLVNECDEILAHYVRAALRAMKNPIDPPWTLPRVRLDGQRLYLAGKSRKTLDSLDVMGPSRGLDAAGAHAFSPAYAKEVDEASGRIDVPRSNPDSVEGKVA